MRRLAIAILFCLASVSAFAAGDALPAGYLSVSGNQIVSGSGANVRLACIGYNEPTGNYSSDMSSIRAAGFNCARYPYYDINMNLTTMDAIVTAATANNIRIIFDHHGNEADSACLGQQSNGLWYDLNAGAYTATNNTDGCGKTGTITYATFKANWVTIATRYAGNATVIGFDLHNEPLTYGNGQNTKLNWGGGGGADILAMFQDVGNAIHAANPGALIICEGPITNSATLFSNQTQGIGLIHDLSLAQSKPVNIPGKVVYSVHDYPTIISSATPDSGATKITAMNNAWGYLVKNNIAPVWNGEMGADMDNSDGALTDQQAWANTLVAYMNGLSGGSGGPTFTGTQQGMGMDWWTFGYLPGQQPNGIFNSNGSLKSGQQAVWSQLLYHSSSSQSATTWNASDASSMNLTVNNLVATSAVTAANYATPGSGSFVSGGNTYSIDSGGNALKNGVAIPGGGGTSAMELYGGQIYAQDAATGNWFTFDGTNFTAASAPPAVNSGAGVRTTSGKSTGKFCATVTETATTSHAAVAIASAAESLTAYPGNGGPSVGLFGDYNSGQPIYANGTIAASNSGLTNLANGDIVTVVVDATNSLIWFSSPEMVANGTSWNHSASADPTTGTGGISITYITKPYYLMVSAQESGASFTLNTTPSTCPSGVPAWDSVVANVGRPITVILGQRTTGSILLPVMMRFH